MGSPARAPPFNKSTIFQTFHSPLLPSWLILAAKGVLLKPSHSFAYTAPSPQERQNPVANTGPSRAALSLICSHLWSDGLPPQDLCTLLSGGVFFLGWTGATSTVHACVWYGLISTRLNLSSNFHLSPGNSRFFKPPVYFKPSSQRFRTANQHLRGGIVAEPGPQSPHVCEGGRAHRVPPLGSSAGLLQIATNVPNLWSLLEAPLVAHPTLPHSHAI